MNIYDFIQMINDTSNVVFLIFDLDTGNRIYVSDDEDDVRTEFDSEMLLDSKYADLEISSMDMWIADGKIYIEFNVDIEEEARYVVHFDIDGQNMDQWFYSKNEACDYAERNLDCGPVLYAIDEETGIEIPCCYFEEE
jgi:hypothetical protein